MLTLLNIIGLVLFVYAAFAVGYLFFFAMAGALRKRSDARIYQLGQPPYRRFAVLIPAYKEDAVIVGTVRQALQQVYPRSAYQVVVIADSLQPHTLDALCALPVRIITVSFDQSTKAKALNAAFEMLPGVFDAGLILDADNVMDPHCLAKLNASFAQGHEVIQVQRVAKNTDTPLAQLDAWSEHINNHIFRKGHAAVGLSAALIGSGMAVRFSLLKRYMAEVQAIGGFDKELELRLLRDGIRFAYLEEARVYDEKVAHAEVFVKQRTRWLAAQGHYLRHHFWGGVKALWQSGNLDYFDKALQLLLPPRSLLLGVLPMVTLLSVFLPFGGTSWAWATLLIVFAWTLMLAVPMRSFTASSVSTLKALPRAIGLMARALAKSPTGNRSFLHTPHRVVTISLSAEDAR